MLVAALASLAMACTRGADAAKATAGLSCAAGGPGLTDCGASRESCCTSLPVSGGTFDRTYGDLSPVDGGFDASPDLRATHAADPATVSGFRLDKYLVTVGRFRQFVIAWNAGSGYRPTPGSGKHTHLNGGRGLADGAKPNTYELGWDESDDNNIAPTNANLTCLGDSATWTPSRGKNETLPINCVNWYESYAFCIWDGGFLPSTAEWEYAAAGGGEQRKYPWGAVDPGVQNRYAIYGDSAGHCYFPTFGTCLAVENIAPVGTATKGAGRWGQLDLVGNLWEWNLDFYVDDFTVCTDCADVTNDSHGSSGRVFRGGFFYSSKSTLLATARNAGSDRSFGVGFRCARAP